MLEYIDDESTMGKLNDLDSIEIYNNGKIERIEKDNEIFNLIKTRVEEVFLSARVMPAFGVSLHNETTKAMKQENWLKLNFNKEKEKNGLPYSSLVFKLENGYGTNLIREYNGKLDGRCIYLDFDKLIDLLNLIKH